MVSTILFYNLFNTFFFVLTLFISIFQFFIETDDPLDISFGYFIINFVMFFVIWIGYWKKNKEYFLFAILFWAVQLFIQLSIRKKEFNGVFVNCLGILFNYYFYK